MLDPVKNLLADNAILLTYRSHEGLGPSDCMVQGFMRFEKAVIRTLGMAQNRKWACQRRPVGVAAMDYDGSRAGYFVKDTRQGRHVHAVWVLHPEIKEAALALVNEKVAEPRSPLLVEPVTTGPEGLRNVVHYTLKGVMNDYGFYKGRDDQLELLGPKLDVPFTTVVTFLKLAISSEMFGFTSSSASPPSDSGMASSIIFSGSS